MIILYFATQGALLRNIFTIDSIDCRYFIGDQILHFGLFVRSRSLLSIPALLIGYGLVTASTVYFQAAKARLRRLG